MECYYSRFCWWHYSVSFLTNVILGRVESEVARIGIYPDGFVICVVVGNNPQVDDIVLQVIGELYLE